MKRQSIKQGTLFIMSKIKNPQLKKELSLEKDRRYFRNANKARKGLVKKIKLENTRVRQASTLALNDIALDSGSELVADNMVKSIKLNKLRYKNSVILKDSIKQTLKRRREHIGYNLLKSEYSIESGIKMERFLHELFRGGTQEAIIRRELFLLKVNTALQSDCKGFVNSSFYRMAQKEINNDDSVYKKLLNEDKTISEAELSNKLMEFFIGLYKKSLSEQGGKIWWDSFFRESPKYQSLIMNAINKLDV